MVSVVILQGCLSVEKIDVPQSRVLLAASFYTPLVPFVHSLG